MEASQQTLDWLLESDPSLKWQVERDLVGAPTEVWHSTKVRTGFEGYGALVLSVQDPDGQWAGGAYFPTRAEPRALVREGDESGQPFIATTWSLKDLREWGVDAKLLGDTAERLRAICKWEYKDLPYWDGEVDVCINAFTIATGAWLGLDMSKNAEWFLEHQLADGGWNCEWVEGSTRSSLHSTLNALVGLLNYEKIVGKDAAITAARKRAEEYLLERKLMFGLQNQELLADWVTEFTYPFRWRYSTLRALDYFREACLFDETKPDARLVDAVATVKAAETSNQRWLNQHHQKGSIWVETDVAVGQESKWLTFYALRVLDWWEAERSE